MNVGTLLGQVPYATLCPNTLNKSTYKRNYTSLAVNLGRVEREYGLGRQRTDLLITWPNKNSCQRTVIELKLQYGKRETTIQQGLIQTYEYMDRCGANEGYLLIFNRASKKSWKDKIFTRREIYKGSVITVYVM